MPASNPPSLPLLLLLISCLLALSSAATTSSTATPTATASATIYTPTAHSQWAYNGCYNETTLANGTSGQRALNGGVMSDLTTMTVLVCLQYCQDNKFDFAGVEYARECYCAPLLSAISAKLPDAQCNLPCMGNSSQLCGGALHVSVYEVKSTTQGAAHRGVREAPLESILALGIAIGVLLCLA